MVDVQRPALTAADRIRAFVARHYLQNARAKGLDEVRVVAGDVHKAMGLVNRMPAVCSVLDGKILLHENDLELVERTGPPQGATAAFRYRILDTGTTKSRSIGDAASNPAGIAKVAGPSRFASALGYAALIHAKQKRKGTNIPYVSHVMSVSALVMEFGGDEDQAIAGLFHDALEDCGAWHEKVIRANWGERVAQIVRACTDGVTDAQGKKEPWRLRKERYLAHLRQVSEDVLLVSACDKLHNARAIAADLRAGHDVFARFNTDAGRDGTLWYYTELESVFRERLGKSHSLYGEYAAAVRGMSGL